MKIHESLLRYLFVIFRELSEGTFSWLKILKKIPGTTTHSVQCQLRTFGSTTLRKSGTWYTCVTQMIAGTIFLHVLVSV